MVRFPEARGGRAIAQLPQNFSRLRRAIQSLYVFFHITKISSISFLLRHIWRTPRSHISPYLADPPRP